MEYLQKLAAKEKTEFSSIEHSFRKSKIFARFLPEQNHIFR